MNYHEIEESLSRLAMSGETQQIKLKALELLIQLKGLGNMPKMLGGFGRAS